MKVCLKIFRDWVCFRWRLVRESILKESGHSFQTILPNLWPRSDSTEFRSWLESHLKKAACFPPVIMNNNYYMWLIDKKVN